jgi:hypothetical protein
MSTFKEFGPNDIKTTQDFFEVIQDTLQTDISSSSTRRKSETFVTGGIGPGVTSSLWHTVFDQDYSLQTANPVMNITFGISPRSSLVSGSVTYTDSRTGKQYFPSQSLMMREKTSIYKQFAQVLLGNSNLDFQLVSGSTTSYVREPLFITFTRLASRDGIKRESFAIKTFVSSAILTGPPGSSKIFTDVGSTANIETGVGGQVSVLVDSSNTSFPVGLLYLDRGIAILDTQRIFYVSQSMTGSIRAVNSSGTTLFSGSCNQFFVSACLDDILDHVCTVRFSSSNETAIAFKNLTTINSTIYYCRFEADEFNYSSNPTYTDSNNRIVVIEPGQEARQRSFTFITSIGGYDALGRCLWNAKISRPVMKDYQRSFVIEVANDF